MKEVKYSAVGSSSTSSVEVAGNLITRFWSPKLPAHFNAGLVTVAVVSLMIVLQIRDTLKSGLFDDFKRMIHPLDPPDEVDLPQRWNYSSHEFLPTFSDWDEQRVRWIEADPNLKLPEGARPRVMMVTGSSQNEGELYMLSHLLLRAGKNKQDYSQMHDMELFYNMVNPDPEFSDWWVKLPTVRMLMLRHPEVRALPSRYVTLRVGPFLRMLCATGLLVDFLDLYIPSKLLFLWCILRFHIVVES